MVRIMRDFKPQYSTIPNSENQRNSFLFNVESSHDYNEVDFFLLNTFCQTHVTSMTFECHFFSISDPYQ